MLHDTTVLAVSTGLTLMHELLIITLSGTNPFINVGDALLAIANTVKVPLAAIAFIIAGAAQALHSPRASGMWISAVIAAITLFGATGIAAYLGANIT